MSYKTKKYGPMHLAMDVILVCLTGPIWIIWIFVRESRRK